MPDLVCGVCGHTFFERSELAVLSPCPECDEDAVALADDEGGPPPAPGPTADPLAEARRAAAQLLSEHGPAQPPIDVEALAEQSGLSVERRALGDVSGELRDRRRIVVNRDHALVRQRFTIAHEMGHFILHTDHGAGRDAERQADVFAGALLIPPAMLRRAVAETELLSDLRRRFNVSRPAMLIALEGAHLSRRVEVD